MHPVIFKLGPVTIYSYGLCVGLAFLLGLYFAKKEAIRKNIKVELIYDVSFFLVIAGLLSARIYYLLFFDPAIFSKDPIAIFKFWEGGLAVHGAILGGLVAGFLFSKLHKISFWKIADIVSPSIILGQAIGRIGCFLNSCCYGLPTSSIVGVYFPEGSLPDIAYQGLAVFPTQLYESLLNVIGFFVLWLNRQRFKFDGGVFLLYLMLYSIIRLPISLLRGDSLYIWNTDLKTAQVISVLIFLMSLVIFIRASSNYDRTKDSK